MPPVGRSTTDPDLGGLPDPQFFLHPQHDPWPQLRQLRRAYFACHDDLNGMPKGVTTFWYRIFQSGGGPDRGFRSGGTRRPASARPPQAIPYRGDRPGDRRFAVGQTDQAGQAASGQQPVRLPYDGFRLGIGEQVQDESGDKFVEGAVRAVHLSVRSDFLTVARG